MISISASVEIAEGVKDVALYIQALMKSLLLLFLFVGFTIADPSYGLGLFSVSSVASATTDYYVGISLVADPSNIINVQIGATMAVMFPSDYTDRIPNGTISCSLNGWGDPFASFADWPTPSCSASATTVTISNLFTRAYALDYQFDVTILIPNIVNPLASGATGTFYAYVYLSSGTPVITATGISISPTTMTCSLSTSPTTISRYGAVSVLFLTPQFTTSSTITINFNQYWPQTTPQSITIIPALSSVACSPVLNADSSISCSFVQSGVSNYEGVVSNIVSTGVKATSISFQFGPVWTPPTTMPQGSFVITARNSGRTMSQCTGTVSGMTAGSLTSPQLTPATSTVNSLTQLTLSFAVNTNIVTSDTITVTFPVQISLSSLTQVFLPSTTTNVSPTITGQTLNITGARASTNGTLSLAFDRVLNPTSELATSTFTITTSRNSFVMDTLSTSLTYSATRASITSAILSASNLQIGVTTTYTLQFSIGQALTANSAVVVGLPAVYQGKVGGCSPAPCSVGSNAITFTSIANTVGSVVSLTLTNVVNPLTIGLTTSLVIYTLYSSSQPSSFVEYTNSGLSVSLVARIIPASNIAISSTSQVVSYFPSSFTFTITNINALPAYTYLKVYIPNEIGVSAAQVNCQAGSAAVSCTYDSSTRIITFSSLFSAATAAGGLASTPVVINNLANPSSTSPTSSFGVYLYNSLDQMLEYQASGITFTSSQAASFFALNLIPNNTVNSATTSLSVNFAITASSYLNSSLLVVTFPTSINIQLASCIAVSSNLISVSCSVNSNKMQALLTYSSFSTSQSTHFTIGPYQNFPSLQPYQITVQLFADIFQNSKLCTNANAPASFQNTAVGSITISSSSFSNPTLLEATNLNFQLSSVQGHPFSYLIISFPAEFGVASTSCSFPAGITCTIQGYSIVINSTTTIALPLVGAINNIIAPAFSPSSNIYVQSFSSNGYTMDSNTQIFFATMCTLPCRGCISSSQPSLCTSCYSNAALVQGQVYLSNSTCVSVCGLQLYLSNSTNSCSSCVSPCATCQSSSFCYTCTTNYFLYNGSCLLTCPFGFYGFNGLCLVCTAAIYCQSCPNSYECSTCLSGYYRYNSQCYQTCPSLITYPNIANRTCDYCPNNCTNCQGNSSNVTCTACNIGYVLDNGRCYLSCVTSGLIAVSNICQGCASPCNTCSVLVTNCTSCLTSGSVVYLFGNRCLSQCPDGYYQSNSTYSCLLCTSPCELCNNISVHSCLSCISGYYLYQSDCLSVCPSTYYNISGQCSSCVAPCLTCTTQRICTSCVNSTYLYQGQCLPQCPIGMVIVNGNQCLVCNSICKTCSSTTYCQSCFNSTYLYNGTCLGVCPSGTFQNVSTLVCDSCVFPCATCSNVTFCLSCADTTKFVVNGACVDCNSPCATCTGSISTCTSCLSSTSTPFIFNTSCLSLCPSNYYSDNTTYTCTLCVSPCLTCNGPSSSSCISCLGGYYLLGTLCLSACPATYYSNINVCSSCQAPCLTCSGPSICKSCTNSTYLYGSSCVASCGTGLMIFNNSICQYCSTACQTCLSANSSACTSCYLGAYLNQNSQTCGTACSSGFYPDSSTGNGLCLPCVAPCSSCTSPIYCLSCLDSSLFLSNGSCLGCLSPCLTCQTLRNNCTSCNTSSASPYLYNATCNSGCLFGFYPGSLHLCAACSSPCASCFNGSSTACLSCISGYYQLNSTCFSVCPSGYFRNATICSVCVAPCATCSESSICLSCLNNFYLFGSACVSNCSAGMSVINNTKCQYCSSSCSTCQSSNSSSCTSCYPTTYLYGSSCLTTCFNGTYQDNFTNVCQPCLSPCLLCQSATYCLQCLDASKYLVGGSCVGCTSPCVSCVLIPTNCTSCAASTGYPYLYNSMCISACPGGTYGQISIGQCLPCLSPCQTCSSASSNSCTSCISGYLLFQSRCLTVCPSGYYSNNITCFGCSSPCQNCVDNSTCTSCQGGLLLQGSFCVSNCSSGLTAINSTFCSYCSGSCLSCLSSNTSACTSCFSGLYLLGNQCFVDCPSGYYEDAPSSKCIACQNPCSTCLSATNCLSCQDTSLFLVNATCLGCLAPCLTCSTLRTNCTSCDTATSFRYLLNNNCIDSCPARTYPSGLNCSSCLSPCDTCANGSISSCLTCIGGYVLLNSTCLLGCPSGYYSNNLTCTICVPPCSTCSSASLCLSCQNGKYLLGSQCYSNCPGGMIISSTTNGDICVYCASFCNTCLSANSSYCTSCANGTYLHLGQCLSSCPSSHFHNSVSRTCDLCSSPCANCTGPTSCLSCLLTSDFLVGFSCLGCQSPCLTCGGGMTICTSCNTTGAQPYFYQSNCIVSCPITYYASASFNCTLCNSPCYTCTGPGGQSCSSCLFGYLILNSSCYLSCPGGYYNHSNYCLACTSPCFTCWGPGTTACTSCTSGLYLLGSSCVANCSGLAINGSICVYCSSTCLSCQTSNSSYCTSCNLGSYLLNGACVSNCSNIYYADNSLSACMPCVSPCSQCTSATSCLTCIDSTKFLVNSSCVGCSSQCYTCSISVNNCTSCDPLSAFTLLFQNSCVSTCPDTYYQATSSSCLRCSSPCETCTSAGIHACTTCVANSYFLNSSCYSACPSGYFASVTVCSPCNSPCSTCQTTAATCLSCVSGYLLRGSNCVSNCSSGEVVVNGSYCQVCSSNCLTCLSSNYSFCTSCQNSNYLTSGTCSISCPNLTYPDNTTNKCLGCVAPCVQCSSQSSCISCLSSLFLIGSSCQSCQTPCLTCIGTPTNCTSCNISSFNPYLLLGGCLSSCPGGYYDSGAFNCLPCINPCSTCSAGNNRSCISCVFGYSQLGSDCYLICPSGYYSNGTNCIACNSSLCLTCSLSASTCLSCVSPLYLYGSNCAGSCPTGMIVLNGSICQSCSSNCQTCLTLNNSYCTSCYTNNYLFNGVCSTDCPDFYYADVSGICLRCRSPCGQCQSASSCLSCANVLHFLQNFTCVSSCSYPLVGINGTCYQCSSQCFTCTQTVTTCLLCANNFYYFPATFSCELVCSFFVLPKNISSSGNNQCTQACPAGTYANPNTSYCVSCPSACSLCVSGTNCSQCASGFSYYLYFCYDPCPLMAPYSINYQCIMCNISNCQTCLNTTYCSVCVQNYLLIAEGNASKCISSCASNQRYEASSLACINNPTSNQQTNIVNSAVPPYTFAICAISLTFALFIVKFKNPSSHFGMAMMLMVNLVASATMANLLYIEITSSGINKGEFSGVSVTTALVLSAGGVQLLASVGSVIATLKIRDLQLVKVWQKYPISSIVIVAVSLIDSNFIFLPTTELFSLELFQANFSSPHMTIVLKFSLVSSLLVKSLSLVYSAMQLMFYNSKAYRLLTQTVAYPIENSATIQFLIISLVGLGFVVYLLCTLAKEDKEQDTKEQSHQSLMDEANAFDKRLTHDSNAHIVMSDHDGMVIDLNSLDEDHVPSSKRVSKKVTPDEMLQRMGQNQQNQQNQIEGEDLVVEEILFVQEERPQSKKEENENDQAQQPQEGTPHTHGLPTSEERGENDLHNGSLFFAEKSFHEDELAPTDPRIADISQIVCPEVPVAEKSKTNIFQTDQIEGQINDQQKHKTFVLDLNKEDKAEVKPQPDHSPSQISKYKPNQEIANQFAQNSYMDDANRFNEHYFEKQKQQIQNRIMYQIQNNDYFQGSPGDYSFQKRQEEINPEPPIPNAIFVRRRQQLTSPNRQQVKRQQVTLSPCQEPQHFDIAQIEEEEDYKQTPEISTPIVNTYIEDIEDEDELRPSEGLKGKRKRDQRRKPEIPLPKNQAEKDIINIYHKKPKERRSPGKRYTNMPPIPSKASNYAEYSMQENEFVEEKKVFKPIFSGEIKRDAASRYKSIEYNQGAMDEEMPAKPSLKLRKSSFKKIGEMIVESQNSSRK